MSSPSTLYDKLWDSHLVHQEVDGTAMLYVDRHLINEVTSAQAFEALAEVGRKPWNANANLAVSDHVVPTLNRAAGINDELSRLQIETLEANCRKTAIQYIALDDVRQGILHIVGPEQGATLPGTTIVCGDSHTSTHGAFGALAFGIGTSEIEHVLATQTLLMQKSKSMLVCFQNELRPGCYAKDMALAFIRAIGSAGGTGHVVEYAGPAVAALSMEGRMTLCNMTIEAGARAGIVAVDSTTIEYLKGRPLAPVGEQWDAAEEYWRTLHSDERSTFDTTINIDASSIAPHVTWGTTPDMVEDIGGSIPELASISDAGRQTAVKHALQYMGLKSGQKLTDIRPDRVFIGSCTNARIEDLREAAFVVARHGGKLATNVKEALVVPGSGLVKLQAEKEGLHEVFLAAGFQWREPGCSMCLAMNADRLLPGERCASTSNRNFEGRQGNGGRSHLMSPAMAAAAALEGVFVDVGEILK